MRERALRWDGCVNVRDLGGHRTEDGAETAYGAVVRADNLALLSDTGWDTLVAYGVNTILDLRWADERADDPAHRRGVDVVHVALFGDESGPLAAERGDLADEGRWADVRCDVYLERLESHPDRFASAIAAIAEAPDGCVAVHCAGGVDRTGLVSALVLRLSGVPIATIANDYADSELSWSPHVGDWIGEASDERERQRRRFLANVPAATMVCVLEALEGRYGGVHGYLRRAGTSEESLRRVRAKLLP